VPTTPSGLTYEDTTEGTGASPRPGQTAVVHYTGYLTDGTKFDSSVDRGQPFSFSTLRVKLIAKCAEVQATGSSPASVGMTTSSRSFKAVTTTC